MRNLNIQGRDPGLWIQRLDSKLYYTHPPEFLQLTFLPCPLGREPRCTRMGLCSSLRYPPSVHDLASKVVAPLLAGVLKIRALVRIQGPAHLLLAQPLPATRWHCCLQKPSLGVEENEGHPGGALEKSGPRAGQTAGGPQGRSAAALSRIFSDIFFKSPCLDGLLKL